MLIIIMINCNYMASVTIIANLTYGKCYLWQTYYGKCNYVLMEKVLCQM